MCTWTRKPQSVAGSIPRSCEQWAEKSTQTAVTNRSDKTIWEFEKRGEWYQVSQMVSTYQLGPGVPERGKLETNENVQWHWKLKYNPNTPIQMVYLSQNVKHDNEFNYSVGKYHNVF